MISLQNETLTSLFDELKIDGSKADIELDLLARTENRYLKDLKINVLNVLKSTNLSKKEAALLAFATAVNEKNASLTSSFKLLSEENGASENEISEVVACVSLLNVNNVFYRFRHFVEKEYYNTTPAGIKMSIMMNPVLGKEFFELISLAISALNGCELCVKSHEESVLQHGSSQPRVYDAIRLAAVIKGFSAIIK